MPPPPAPPTVKATSTDQTAGRVRGQTRRRAIRLLAVATLLPLFFIAFCPPSGRPSDATDLPFEINASLLQDPASNFT